MSFYLALDAGGTKTTCALVDETRELARVRTGTVKRMRTDHDTATHHLETALAALTARTGVSMHHIRRTCVGTAGETVPLVANWLRAALSERVSGELLLVGDVEIALDAAFPGRPGIVVIAGTGSNVAGRSHAGEVTTTGGWGPMLADQGSGNRIGLEALRAAFLGLDEAAGPPAARHAEALLEAILAFWKLPSRDHLIEHANGPPAPDYAALTPLVVRAAREGNRIAQAVLRQQGEDLAYLVRLMARRLLRAAPSLDWVPGIAFTGSVLEHVAPVREALIASVLSEFPTMQPPTGVVDPLAGAIWRARG